MGLNPKQRKFVDEYLVDCNATQAAIRCGYSPKNADVSGPRLLGNVGIKAEVERRLAARADRFEVQADEVLRKLLQIANADIRKAYDAEGNAIPVHQLPDELALTLAGVEIEEHVVMSEDEDGGPAKFKVGQTKKLKLNDRLRALELLGKNLKLFTEKVDVTVKGTIEVVNSYMEGERE